MVKRPLRITIAPLNKGQNYLPTYGAVNRILFAGSRDFSSSLYSSFVLLKERDFHKSEIEDGIESNEIAGFDKISG